MTQKQYQSVAEMVRDTSDNQDLVREVAVTAAGRQLIKHLIAHRVKQDLTQKGLADRIQCSQSPPACPL